VVFNEVMFLFKGGTEVGLVIFEAGVLSGKGVIFLNEFGVEGNNIGFTIGNSLGEFLDFSVDNFNVVGVVKGLFAIRLFSFSFLARS